MFNHISNTKKRVENIGVFLTNFEVFASVDKHCLECLFIFSNKTKTEEKREKE